MHVSNIFPHDADIDVGRRGGDIIEHHRGGNIATKAGDKVTSVGLRPINRGYW